ncbi:DNA primase [Lawsonia intracellularis]|uniref:DNA primase n=1 Tax=Lawsonia intracellularis (strain PHE/MN1-00) TaxID=363253 RepID=Q1MR04_LAWIP|nr:DNA primase [Lawsonia intracellularis]AGC49932.1 DNA primase [Lawsonia intracellularis N343]KAA0205430.1 DNA primase [Lawsonia intracellularis]MBZ3892030.1 DNA primase [Lawsonia intracellularis]OMQ04693.1 DNA primase [Lawsonia intracellularis]RBN32021.1 DNA primase [Lawsonia intracellularis]
MSQKNVQAIQEIKSRLNIVDIVRQYVKLHRNGSRWVAPCPFHQETKPSFSVSEEDGFFYCFGCQASGDIFTFYSQINGLSFRETLEQLAEEAGVILTRFSTFGNESQKVHTNRRQLLKIYEFTTTHFVNNLHSEIGKECREYMKKRGISDEISQYFRLGWSSSDWDTLVRALKRAGFHEQFGVEAALVGIASNGKFYDRFRGRLMFPISSLSGNIIAFGGRIIGDEDTAKYINSSDSLLYKKGDQLYGLQQARQSISSGKSILITEGYMDVITLHQYGYTNAVGVLGTALTSEQVKRISGFTSNIEILFDGDAPGRKAALRACEMFLTKGLNCKVVLFPEGEDIDSVIKNYGKEFFEKLKNDASEGLQFCIQSLKTRAPRDVIDWVKNFLKQVELPEIVSRFTSILSTGLGLAESELREYVADIKHSIKKKVTQSAAISHSLVQTTPRDKQILMFLVRYPHMLDKLKEQGAHLVLNTTWAKELWGKVEEYSEDNIMQYLNSQEKTFWVQCRTGDVPPLDNEEGEFEAIQTMLEALHMTVQSASVSAALKLGKTSSFEADLKYLRALQETLERTHGE